MSKERELLQRLVSAELNDIFDLLVEAQQLLAQPEQEPFAVVANNSVGFDVSRSPQGMPLVWLGKLEYGDKLYRVRARDE
jgi:hypothetical protein